MNKNIRALAQMLLWTLEAILLLITLPIWFLPFLGYMAYQEFKNIRDNL